MCLYIYDHTAVYLIDLIVCCMMLPTLQTLCCPVVVSLVNYGLEVIWKESFMVSWRLLYQNMSIVQGKGKAIPLQAWTGP